MKLLYTTTALALLLSTGPLLAAVNTDAVIAGLRAQGYTRIEVKTGPSQVKVEAIRGTEQVEVVYDKETGAVLKSEVGAVEAGEDIGAGVSIRDEDDDFVDGDADDDEDSPDDEDEDDDADEADDEDDGDDNSGKGRGRGRGGDDGDDD